MPLYNVSHSLMLVYENSFRSLSFSGLGAFVWEPAQLTWLGSGLFSA